ncbi:hypothetical protein [Dysgonomonas sp. ZJ709]|uniref:hypothetical protein n=1 Tax=Dysgonomonas sp. ZJ709 TaxID=2709797 RepID=UPI0013EBAF3C|nr:hypothetical protein [Dysgonomonas sp. ZJ709]
MEIILDFDFTFEIPRNITFHVAAKDVQTKIHLILNQFYESIIPVFDETKD